jgi:hypothetical protein
MAAARISLVFFNFFQAGFLRSQEAVLEGGGAPAGG